MSPILCISDFEIQCKHSEKFRSNFAENNGHRKSKVFLHVLNCSSLFSHPDFFRLKCYRSAAKKGLI